MKAIYDFVMEELERALSTLSAKVPPPKLVRIGPRHEAFRYVEQSIYQAMILKMARIISALRAGQLLLDSGFLQEQGAIMRMIDETQEDLIFFGYGLLQGVTPLHTKALKAFFAEPYEDPARPVATQTAYETPRRKQIHAYLASAGGASPDSHGSIGTMQTILRAYSGFVHGAAASVMELLDENAEHGFHLSGQFGTDHAQSHRDDIFNYFFRSVTSFAAAAGAFAEWPLFHRLHRFSAEMQTLRNS